MANWDLSAVLVEGRHEIDARWPGRPTESDGTIGDQAHAAEGYPRTKHMPNPRRFVHAFDCTYPGVDPYLVIAVFQRHPNAHLWIFNREIALRREGWVRRRYTGTSAHTEHIHFEDEDTVAAEHDSRPWGLATALPTQPVVEAGGARMERMPTLRQSTRILAAVKVAQRGLRKLGYDLGRSGVDGQDGPRTTAIVRSFQQTHRLGVDGVVGPKTWTALLQALLGQVAVDGTLGPASQARIRAVQAQLGLHVDGIVGPLTWAAILR
jgi:hypothetical protein